MSHAQMNDNKITPLDVDGHTIIRAPLGFPISAHIVKANKIRRCLVVVRLGNDSEFMRWFDASGTRDWDVMLSFYTVPANPIPSSVESIIVGGRSKMSSVKEAFANNPELLESYEYLLFLDDDIIMRFEDVDHLFDMARTYCFDLCQASLSHNSQTHWWFLKQNPRTKLRYTNFVEVMMPLFSQSAFKACVNTFDQAISGWGLDFIWPHILGYRPKGLGVIDLIVAEHLKGVDLRSGPFYTYLRSINVDPEREMAPIASRYALNHSKYGVQSVVYNAAVGEEGDWLLDHAGENYLVILKRLHDLLQPKSYLEIGSRTGESLACSSCSSIAVDPAFALANGFHGAKKICALYQMTSDKYFAHHNPVNLVGAPLDFVFLDGMHLAEFLFRDFVNVENFCRPNSIIAIHDCLPLNSMMAHRSESLAYDHSKDTHPGWWTGDIWKTIEAIKKHRPDLNIYAIDAEPTGLILITGLNPASKILSDQYNDITREFRELSVTKARYLDYVSSLEFIPRDDYTTLEGLSKYFWL